jgi:hypothetical protein
MRECGECTACCTVTHVPELQKPIRVTCNHCKAGCSIYEDRPASCRAYACAWLQGDLKEDMRPDKIGVMFEKHGTNIVAALRHPHPGNGQWRTPEIEKELRSTYVEKGVAVVADDWTAMIPAGVKPDEVRAAVFEALDKAFGE